MDGDSTLNISIKNISNKYKLSYMYVCVYIYIYGKKMNALTNKL